MDFWFGLPPSWQLREAGIANAGRYPGSLLSTGRLWPTCGCQIQLGHVGGLKIIFSLQHLGHFWQEESTQSGRFLCIIYGESSGSCCCWAVTFWLAGKRVEKMKKGQESNYYFLLEYPLDVSVSFALRNALFTVDSLLLLEPPSHLH